MTLKIILLIVLTILYIAVSYFAGNYFFGDADDKTIDKICYTASMGLFLLFIFLKLVIFGCGIYFLINFIF